jgi:HK97 family phage portal protein
LWQSGILASGILRTDQDLKPEQAKGLAEVFKAALGGFRNTGKVGVLGRGVSFEQLTIPPQDAQFLESREFQVVEVARWYGVTPALLMDPGATMNWGEGAKQQFVTFTLNPWLKRVEQAVSLHLLPRGQFAEYTRAGLLEADLAVKTSAYATAVQFGWISRAEVRALENMPAGPPELDEFLSPANLGGAANGQATPGEEPTLEDDDEEESVDA